MYDATMLEDGDSIHIGICHSDGSVSMVHIARTGDVMGLAIESSESHSVIVSGNRETGVDS